MNTATDVNNNLAVNVDLQKRTRIEPTFREALEDFCALDSYGFSVWQFIARNQKAFEELQCAYWLEQIKADGLSSHLGEENEMLIARAIFGDGDEALAGRIIRNELVNRSRQRLVELVETKLQEIAADASSGGRFDGYAEG